MTTFRTDHYDMRLVLLLFLLGVSHLLNSQCSCTDCPVFLPSNQTVTSTFDVSGSTNDILGSNGQGLLAVCLDFVHDAIDEIDMTLIAPDGSSVLLIDNTGISVNDDMTFQICFVACAEDADPDPGFPEVFSSDENWVSGQSYSGTYYPSTGNLEDLTGSINGTWTIEVTDFVGADDGTIFDWCLQFADDVGLGCGNSCYQPQCGAIAGELPNLSDVLCTGDDDLDLDIDPILCDGADPGLFAYTYVITDGDNGEILQFSDDPDLTGYDPGIYTICGLSYLIADEPLLPNPPLGVLFTDLEAIIDDGTICADLSSSCITITILDPPPVPDFTSDTIICVGSMETFTLLNFDPELTWDFTWELVGGGGDLTVFDTEDEITLTFPTTGLMEVCWTATNECGSADSCYIIEVIDQPDLQIAGLDVVCPGSVHEYIAAALPPIPSVDYLFTVSGGIVQSQNDSAITIEWDGSTGDAEICVELDGFACNTPEFCIDVSIEEYTPPAEIQLPDAICIGSTGVASIPDNPSIVSVVWSGTGIIIVSGQGTNEIEFDADQLGVGEVCAEITSSCGGFETVCTLIDIFEIPVPIITGVSPMPECGDPFNISVSVGSGTVVEWTLIDGPPGGADILDPNSTNPTVIVSGPGIYTFVVSESIDDCIGYDTITIDVTGTPIVVNAMTECNTEGEFIVTFDIVEGVEPYSVNGVPIIGGTFVSDPFLSGESYSFTISDQNGCFVLYEGTEDCPCVSLEIINIDDECITPDEFVLTFEVISGNPPYTVNVGGTFTTSVFTSDLLSTSISTNVTVTDADGCTGDFVIGPVNCDCDSEAGVMSTQLIELCEGDNILNVQYLGGATLDADDIERFVIHTGSGNVIENLVLETMNDNILLPLMLLQPGVAYYVSHVVGNELVNGLDFSDPCLNVSPGQPFIINPTPVFSIQDSAETCPGTIGIAITNAGIDGQLNLISNTGGEPINLVLIGNTISVGSGIGTIVEVEYVESNGGCEKRDTVVVSFFETPDISNLQENCTGNEFTVSFEIEGLEPYTVNGQQIAGNTFVSDTFDTGEMAEFLVMDAYGCAVIFSTTTDCLCSTDAGTLSGFIGPVCEGMDVDISGLTLNVGQLDPEDSIYLVVHDGTMSMFGSIIDTPEMGIIEYKPEFVTGETYYIVAIAGNVLNGGIDPDDPCFSISNGIEVVWSAASFVSLNDSLFACEGDFVIIPYSVVGGLESEMTIVSSEGRDVTVDISAGELINVQVLPGIEVWTIDNVTGDCPGAGNGEFVIVGDEVVVPEIDSAEACNNPLFGSVLNLNDLIINGVSGTWSSADFLISNDVIDFDGATPGQYTIQFETVSTACPPEMYQVNVTVLDCDCPIIALPFGVDLCETVSGYDLDERFNITIGGVWSIDNTNALPQPPVIDNNILDLVGSTPGAYMLVFTITESLPDQCTDEFSLVLNVVSEPEPGMQAVFPVLCEGIDQQLDLNSVLEASDPGGNWTFGGASVNNVISSSILVAGSNTFTYSVENGLCGEMSVDVIIALGLPPEAGQQASTERWCEGLDLVLKLDNLLSGADAGGAWTLSEQVLDFEVNVNTLPTGENVLQYIVGSGLCADTATVIIEIIPLPEFTLSLLDVSCFGAQDGFISVEPVDLGTGPYIISINNTPQEQISNAAAGSYSIVVEDYEGCQTIDVVVIDEPDSLELFLAAPDTVYRDDVVAVEGVTNLLGIVTGNWQFEGSLVDSSVLDLVYLPGATDTVSLELLNGDGCLISAEAIIVVIDREDTVSLSEVHVPNVFNPTSQNQANRFFKYYTGSEPVDVTFFRVFDRWGALLFELTDVPAGAPIEGWDGTYNGRLVNPGVFVYSLSYSRDGGEEQVRIGDVTVVR